MNNIKKTFAHLFLSFLIWILSIFIISFLFDYKLWFSFHLDFHALGSYLDMTISLWKTIFTDWIFWIVICIWAIITFIKKRSLKDAIDFSILGFHSNILLKIIWTFILIGSVACLIDNWICTLMSWFAALLIPYVAFLTTYSILQKSKLSD